jgi:hypothetical protein
MVPNGTECPQALLTNNSDIRLANITANYNRQLILMNKLQLSFLATKMDSNYCLRLKMN